MALTNIDGIENMVMDNLTDSIETSEVSVPEENSNTEVQDTTTVFEDDDSMDFLMNKIGLQVQRNGGE